MIRSVQYRQKSFLDTEEWRTKPWNGYRKIPQYRLSEHGFELGTLIEESDHVGLREGKLPLYGCLGLIDRYVAIDTKLDAWFREFQDESPRPLLWADDSISTASPDNESYLPLSFPSLHESSAILEFWGLKLVLSNLILAVVSGLLGHNPILNPYAPSVIVNASAREKILRLSSNYGRAQCIELAKPIIRAIPYVLGDDKGCVGASQALFPLRVALFTLSRYPGEELRRCQEAYEQLAQNKGLNFAKVIATADGPFAEEQNTIVRGQSQNEAFKSSVTIC